jgi:hypothetical protein
MEIEMQKWSYLRLTGNYRGENEIFDAISNGRQIFTKEAKTNANDLQKYVENLGNEGWDLVNVYQDSQLCEIYHFKRPIEE